jgi:hypothetical protein
MCDFIIELRLEDQIDHVNTYIGSLQYWRVMAFDNLFLNGVDYRANEQGQTRTQIGSVK